MSRKVTLVSLGEKRRRISSTNKNRDENSAAEEGEKDSMAMEKKKQRVSFGTQKQILKKRKMKTKTKTKKKQFLKKVIDYLISDSYMYAPLISSTPSSGSHLSSNLITSLTTGPFGYLKRIIEAISTRKRTNINQQTNKNSANGLGEDHPIKACNTETNGLGEDHIIKACNPETDFVDQEGLERDEMVKRIVHRTSLLCASSYSIDNIERCSTTSPTGDDFINTKIK